MDNRDYFYFLVAGFTFGIFVSSLIKVGFSFFLFILLLSIIIFVFGYYFARRNALIILLAVLIFFFGLGVLRYEIKDIRSGNNLQAYLGDKVILQGVVSDEPSIKDNSVQLIVSVTSLYVDDKEEEVEEKVLVTTGLFPEFKYGDLVKVEGMVKKPENFSTDNGKDFNYIGYLAKDDIFYQISFAEVEIISRNNGSYIKDRLFTFKNAFINKINLTIKEPESSLLSGLLLGAKNSLGSDLQEDFRQAGVSHIIALSGYNITIVAESIMVALSFLPQFASMSFGILGIILFSIMTGGSATVLRASIMALLVILARSTGRKYDITRALLLAGVFMLIQNPKILVFDISFQLSFLATLALILVSPIVAKKMTFITEKYKLRELIVSTVVTQIFVLPFLLYKMGFLSIFALFANVLILPVIPLVMLLGFIVGIIGFISTMVIIPVALACSFFLSYILKVIDLVAHLPFSYLMIKNFSLSMMILIYFIFFVIILYSQPLKEKDELF